MQLEIYDFEFAGTHFKYEILFSDVSYGLKLAVCCIYVIIIARTYKLCIFKFRRNSCVAPMHIRQSTFPFVPEIV